MNESVFKHSEGITKLLFIFFIEVSEFGVGSALLETIVFFNPRAGRVQAVAMVFEHILPTTSKVPHSCPGKDISCGRAHFPWPKQPLISAEVAS